MVDDKKSWLLTNFNAKKKRADIVFRDVQGHECWQAPYRDECKNATAQLVDVLTSLHIYSLMPTKPYEDFHQQAVAWRALAEKPALPDAARVYRLMAEDAIKNKKPEAALSYYEQALETFPTWPEGWFNAALLAGELGFNNDAAGNMQNYLELTPDVKDAQVSRDQIDIWRFKAKSGAAAQLTQ